MVEGGDRIVVGIGAVVAVALQVVVAPNIALFHAMPNFMLTFVVVVAVARAQSCGVLLPFALGMLFDLMGTGPVGASALVFTLVAFLVSRAFSLLDNDTLFMPLFLIVVGVVLSEVLYGVLVMACGVQVSPLEALVFRALPCAAYDCVFALLLFPLIRSLSARRGAQGPGAPFLS